MPPEETVQTESTETNEQATSTESTLAEALESAGVPTPETPADGEEAKSAEDTADAAEGRAPQEYEAFTLPEGWEVADDDLAAFNALARDPDVDLSQAGAQKIIDLFTQVESTRTSQIQEWLETAQASKAEEQTNDWVSKLREDPEYETKAAAVKVAEDSGVLKQIPGLLELLTTDNNLLNPPIFNLVAWLGTQMKESPISILNGSNAEEGDPIKTMFSNSGHV